MYYIKTQVGGGGLENKDLEKEDSFNRAVIRNLPCFSGLEIATDTVAFAT